MMESPSRYAPISVAMHWITLLLMVAIYITIELHDALPRENPLRATMEDWHIYFGLLLLPIAIFRAAVFFKSSTPLISPALPDWQMLVAKILKIYLYVLIVGAPILGWVLVSAEGHAVILFGQSLPSIAAVSKGLAELVAEAHELLGLSGYAVISVHALAALYHHYFVKDNTLERMLPKFMVKEKKP